jgi:hypothetical protein
MRVLVIFLLDVQTSKAVAENAHHAREAHKYEMFRCFD